MCGYFMTELGLDSRSPEQDIFFLYRIFFQSVDFNILIFLYIYTLFILLFSQHICIEACPCALCLLFALSGSSWSGEREQPASKVTQYGQCRSIRSQVLWEYRRGEPTSTLGGGVAEFLLRKWCKASRTRNDVRPQKARLKGLFRQREQHMQSPRGKTD